MRAGIAMVVLAGVIGSAGAADLPARKSTQSGVTVIVTPQVLASTAASWTFKVVLDTHTQDLKDDLTKTTVLVDPAGKSQTPVAWEGAAPGGHHREGVLRFAPISPSPSSVELRMQRTGESQTRAFRWRLR